MTVPIWLSKIGLWLKKFGWMILLGILALFTLCFIFDKVKREKFLQEILQKNEAVSKQHREELSELQNIRNEEIRKREETEREYQASIKKIEEEKAKALAELEASKQKEISEITSETSNDPDKMAESINQTFGIPIQKP